jgi:hypothetical protein
VHSRPTARRLPTAQDGVIALVPPVHAEPDRPPRFEQVAELPGTG